MTPPKIAVIICAAGKSSRFGMKKEYQKNEKLKMKNDKNEENNDGELTVLGACVRAFSMVESVGVIAVAIPKGDDDVARAAIPADLLCSSKHKIIFVEGGATRQASVYNALIALKNNEPSYVLIHDGARPWVSVPLIEKTIEAVKRHNAVIPVLEITETPKEHDGVFITRHLKRANTGVAQTPQGFKFDEIFEAHKKASLEDEEFTDDGEIWGKFCGQVAVIPGEPQNKKITYKEDLFG